MSWRPGAKISWRWIIRGTCLGLLGLCVGLWGVSYFYIATVAHRSGRVGDSLAGVWIGIDQGMLKARYTVWGAGALPTGWKFWYLAAPRSSPPFPLHLLDGDFLGFSLGPHSISPEMDWYVEIPLWCPTTLLSLVSLLAWRKTGRCQTGRGFPIEPLASRRENAGG